MSGTVADWFQPLSRPVVRPWAPPTDLTQFPRRFTPPVPSAATWLRPLSEPVWFLPGLAPGDQQAIARPVAAPVIHPPGPPIIISARASTTSITLIWTSGGGDAPTSYVILYQKVGASSWIQISGITALTYTITGLIQNTSYGIRLEAVNSAGGSG